MYFFFKKEALEVSFSKDLVMLSSIFHQYVTIWKIKLIKFWKKIVEIGGLGEGGRFRMEP